jgi:hypothetical protein
MGSTGGLGSAANPGLGAAVAGTEAAMTGPEDELDEVKKGTDNDGAAVGEADQEADVRRSGADDGALDADTGDSAASEDGEPIGAADRDADIDRSM